MSHKPSLIVRIVVVLALVSVGVYWFFVARQTEANGRLTAAGTIEVAEVAIAPEQGGRVAEVLADVGENVIAGQPLVRLDTALLAGQLAQAQAQHAAAQANYAMLAAGPTAAQLSAATAAVRRAQAQLDALNEQVDTAVTQRDDINSQIEDIEQQIATAASGQPANAAAQSALNGLAMQLMLAQQAQTAVSNQIQLLNNQITVAESGVDAAQAQLDLLQAGARPEQLAAAQAQVDAAQATINLIEAQIARQTLIAPVDGVVLARAIAAGEVALPGAALLRLGQMDDLTMTVFVPEDRYGRIMLGQTAVITVDSFPGATFSGVVRHIADRAEFTPRNVQTAEGRASTVFAIELDVQDNGGKLKPGMPADVDFGES
ncbi:MAG: efflux RND transporter periplasmic adaptor subunit [Chloroflexi bacterium]|nr:efflux RND transporter periplasmic adaptor subunit [Chloroflexota bacterium]